MKNALRICVLAVVASLGLASSASAHHWWMDGGNIVHLNRGHMPTLTLFNNATNGSSTAIEHARGEWSGRSWAADLGNWNSNSADVVAWDGWWGTNTWRGLTSVVGYGAGGHANQMTVQLNRSLLPDYIQQRKTACHELGHAIAGLDHDTLGHDPAHDGCMFSGTASSAVQERLPSAHDVHHMDVLWATLH